MTPAGPAPDRPRSGRAGRAVLAVVLAVALLAAAACSGSDEDDAAGLTVFTELVGSQAEAFEAVLADFTDRTGIPVRSVGTTNFEVDLVERLQTGDPPDVALIPQPGLIGGIVRETELAQPLPDDVQQLVLDNYGPVAEDLLQVDGVAYGLFAQASAKSLVWYSPSLWAELGYEVPGTFEELVGLGARMVDDGFRPWCVGLRDGSSSGWVATDWIEDLMLRLEGTEVYDGWVAGEVPFTDERVQKVVETAGIVGLRNPAASGPVRLIQSTPIDVSIDGLLGTPPQCLMHRQASFAAAWLPTGTELGPEGDLDVFVLPDIDGGPAPMLLGGQAAVAFTDSPEAWALMRHLADPALGPAVWATYPGYLAPQETFPLDGYAEPFDRQVAELVRSSELVRFDGSDLMPPRVGVRAFWDEIVAWVGGKPLTLVLVEIQDAWSSTDDEVSIDEYVQAASGDEVEVTPPTVDVPDTAPEQQQDVEEPTSSSTATPAPSDPASTSTSLALAAPEPDAGG